MIDGVVSVFDQVDQHARHTDLIHLKPDILLRHAVGHDAGILHGGYLRFEILYDLTHCRAGKVRFIKKLGDQLIHPLHAAFRLRKLLDVPSSCSSSFTVPTSV